MGCLRDIFRSGVKRVKKEVKYFKKEDREVEAVVYNPDGSISHSFVFECFPPTEK